MATNAQGVQIHSLLSHKETKPFSLSINVIISMYNFSQCDEIKLLVLFNQQCGKVKHEIVIFQALEQANVWHFCSQSDLN